MENITKFIKTKLRLKVNKIQQKAPRPFYKILQFVLFYEMAF